MATAGILGGLAWIPVRLGVSFSYSTAFAGLDYVAWNKLMVIPLGLMIVALVGLLGRVLEGPARVATRIAIAGLAGMLAGTVLEFFVFGGLAGDPAGANAGWTVYLLGLAVHVLGLVVLGVVLRGSALGWAALFIAVFHVAWLPAGTVEGGVLLVADQVGIGLAWVALALQASVSFRHGEGAAVAARR